MITEILAKISCLIGARTAKTKIYYTRGFIYVSIINSVLVIILTLRSFYAPFVALGIPMLLLYAIGALSVIILPGLLGFVDWTVLSHHENSIAAKQTPELMAIKAEVIEINKKLDDMIELNKQLMGR